MSRYDDYKRVKLATYIFIFAFVCMIILSLLKIVQWYVVLPIYTLLCYPMYLANKKVKKDCEKEMMEKL